MPQEQVVRRLQDSASATGSVSGQPSYCNNRRAMLCGRPLNLDDATWTRLFGPNWKQWLAANNIGTTPELYPLRFVYADTLLRLLAVRQKLRSFQLTTQPNSNGGFGCLLCFFFFFLICKKVGRLSWSLSRTDPSKCPR